MLCHLVIILFLLLLKYPIPAVSSSDRVLCFVITTEQHSARCEVIANTWGRHCDTLLFFSDEPLTWQNQSIIGHNIHWEHVPLIPEEARMNLFPKVHAAWMRIYQNYRDAADFFLKADDDTFVIVPNLRKYLAQLEREEGDMWYTGEVHHNSDGSGRFALGGAGYALSRKAILKFGEASTEGGVCEPWKGPEDSLFAKCMQGIGLSLISALDYKGRERMLQLNLQKRFNREVMSSPAMRWWIVKTQNGELGEECCSRDLVSFHNVTPEQMLTYYFAFYSAKRYSLST